MVSKETSSILTYQNNYSTWDAFHRHWAHWMSDQDIINQIMAAAAKYPDTCAECRWGAPIGYNYRQLSTSKRMCLYGYINMRKRCVKFQMHNRLRLWIEAKGISRGDLARMVGLSRHTVTSYCLGHRNFKPVTAQRYADALNIKVEDLIGGKYE